MKKPPQHLDRFDESEIDYGIDEGGPPVFRKDLPLAGTKWEWEGELTPIHFDGPGNPSDYRLEFKPNGWFDFKADCRRGAGIYEIKGEHISMAVIKASHSACHPGSRADDFLSALEAARIFRLAESKLYFELKNGAKTMVFGLKP